MRHHPSIRPHHARPCYIHRANRLILHVHTSSILPYQISARIHEKVPPRPNLNVPPETPATQPVELKHDQRNHGARPAQRHVLGQAHASHCGCYWVLKRFVLQIQINL